MATSMFPNFASTDRRKKVVTYGKSSRLPTIPVTIPPSKDDAPSPERPRMPNAASNGSLKRPGGLLKAGGNSGNTRIRGESPDMFDIPSDDGLVSRVVKPSQKLPTKHKTLQTDPKVLAKEKCAPVINEKSNKAKPASSKAESAKPEVLTTKTSKKSARLARPGAEPSLSSDDPIALSIQRRKIPQITQKDKQSAMGQELGQGPEMAVRVASRSTSTAVFASKPPKGTSTKAFSSFPSTKTLPEYGIKQSEDMNVYDLPSSDEEMPLPSRKPPGQNALGKGKKPNRTTVSLIDASRKESAESGYSNTLKKRKRRGSISSSTTVKSVSEQKQEPPAPQRSSKYQKKENSVSPGHGALEQAANDSISPMPVINKPRRTRVRTVPMLMKPTITKGQSTPAILDSMLFGRNLSRQSPIPEVPEVISFEDETMYEIPDSLGTPVRTSKSTNSNSVTPRQKALFSSLLGESSSSNTPMPKIATLQLTDRKPKSLLGALARSKSDLTNGAQNRKSKLIDTMKRAETGSEDEDEDDEDDEDDASESQSGEESDEVSSSEHVKQQIGRDRIPINIQPDDMDVDHEATAVSQTSQTTSGFGTRSRLTYAKSRSYLEEANLEDALLISMDLDDALGLELHKDSPTDDEENPMSQVQARHELKRRGQQTAFQWETETLINDISEKTSNSVRRSTMLELCTKMADRTFTIQLLESSLAHQFFQNISSNGEIVFDFAIATAVIFVMQTDPIGTVLDQIQSSGIKATLLQLANFETDIARIAKDRKTNLSKIAQESVVKFRALLQHNLIWTSGKPEKMSPQIVALRALELLSTCFRKAGSTTPLVGHDDVSKLVGVSMGPTERLQSDRDLPQDVMVLDSLLSILESASVAKQKPPTWSTGTLQHLADLLPMFFKPDTSSSAMLAVKLCMNLTNNKPKACQQFSRPKFVQPLMSSIIQKFGQLGSELKQEQRTEVLETLILSLGAMINLVELNEVARMNVDGKQMIEKLVKIFVEGSERAAKAKSMEESHSSVAVGYLTVLLGNVCLNGHIRSKVRSQLPNQRLGMLIEKIKEFLKFHERVDGKTREFEESEDNDAWSNYTSRLRLVVDKLKETEV